MNSSSATEELRFPASLATSTRPGRREVPDEDGWPRPGLAPRLFLDPRHRHRAGLGLGAPEDTVPEDTVPEDTVPEDTAKPTMRLAARPGHGQPPSAATAESVDAPTEPGVTPATAILAPLPEVRGSEPDAVETLRRIEEPDTTRGRAVEDLGKPDAAPSDDSDQSDRPAAAGDGGRDAAPVTARTEGGARHRAMVRRQVAVALAHNRRWWILAAAGGAVLVALTVALVVHSARNRAPVEWQPSSDPAAPTTGAYPAAPYLGGTPSDPALPAPPLTDPSADASTRDPADLPPDPGPSTLPSAGPVPADQLPGGPPALSPAVPSAAAPSDPGLNQAPPAQDPAPVTHPANPGRAGRTPPPPRSGPLGDSLDSIVGPGRSDNPDRGGSSHRAPSKPLGNGLPGLGGL